MARTDWVALVTDPAAEYLARTELERFDLHPYLPQIRKRWLAPRTNLAVIRFYPLFPRYLLLPLAQAHRPAIAICRGLRRRKPILADAEGKLWRCSDDIVDAVRQSDVSGR